MHFISSTCNCCSWHAISGPTQNNWISILPLFWPLSYYVVCTNIPVHWSQTHGRPCESQQTMWTTTDHVNHNRPCEPQHHIHQPLAEYTWTFTDICIYTWVLTSSWSWPSFPGFCWWGSRKHKTWLLVWLVDHCCLQDTSDLVTGSANGYYVGQVFFDAFEGRFHHGGGGIVLMGIPMFAMFFCGMSSVISNSRWDSQ